MPRPQASRLQSGGRRRSGFLGRALPYGSWQRRLVLYLAVPLVLLFILAGIFDKIVMPVVTRHGSEFPLPDFTGQRLYEAQVSLNELALEYEISSEEYSPGTDAGVILQQFPVAGTKVKSDRTVKFVVSLGKKMVTIPPVHGMSVRLAILDLETAGLVLGEIEWAFSDTLPERVVVFSYPAAGVEVPLGAAVNLMVNRGRASTFTYMPGIVGLPLEDATRKIEEKGLKVGLVSYRTDENYLPETVLEQSEPEGAELDIDTEIDLVVSAVP